MRKDIHELIAEALKQQRENEPLAQQMLFDQKLKDAENRLEAFAKGQIEKIEERKTKFWKRVGLTLFIVNLIVLVASPWEIGIMVADKVKENIIDPDVKDSMDKIVRENSSDYVEAQLGPFKRTVDDLHSRLTNLTDTIIQAQQLSTQAQEVTNQLQQQSIGVREQLDAITSNLQINALIVEAQNDNLRAFDQLGEIANQANNPNAKLASVIRGSIATAPSVSDILSGDPPWDFMGYKPETITPSECKIACEKYPNIDIKLDIINFVANCARISKADKLDFFAYIIATDPSISAVRHSCLLMNTDSHLNLNMLAYRNYLDWWNKNKEKYAIPSSNVPSASH